jgi:hypothetical protein
VSRILIDPAELAALSALCRNASYDAASIATEARHHTDAIVALLGGDAARVGALVDAAIAQLHRVASQLDDDALAVAQFGQLGAEADALGDLRGNEHGLMTRFTVPGEDNQ